MTGAGNPTLDHYDRLADHYAGLLADHDTSDAIARLLSHLRHPDPTILDLGCGGGRDLVALTAAGARAEGVDGSAPLLRHAAGLTKVLLHHHDLLSPSPPPWQGRRFDALYAHHVLFHLPTSALPALLANLRDWLRPEGLFYGCDPTGDGSEGPLPDGRYLALRRPQSVARLMRKAGFTLVDQWRRPLGVPRRQQGWLAAIWRAPA